jgi:short-subunit dehydrogenase
MSARHKLAFITGASSGLGQALAGRYHRAGFDLALVGRRTSDIETWAKSLKTSVNSYKIYSANVAEPDSIIAAAEACMAQQGLPDVVLACAGMSVGVDTAERSDLDVMAQTFATNNLGTAAAFHAFIKPMVARGSGTLVGLASVNGVRGFAGHGANCPSKAAMISYLECLRLELRSSGVKVVTISPGYVATPLTRGNLASMPFLLQPEDFAERAFRAIEAQVSYRVIPWQMGVVAKALRLLPNWAFDRAFAGRPRKPRASSQQSQSGR